jgi:fused signal recognition particle receptor
MNDNTTTILIAGIIFGIGIIATVIYYFARFYFLTEADQEPSEKIAAAPAKREPPPEKTLKDALAPTRANIYGRLRELFDRNKDAATETLESVEEILYTSDLGPATVQRLLGPIERNLNSSARAAFGAVQSVLKTEMQSILSRVTITEPLIANVAVKPEIWMVVGVNGVGKTTTIGKLAHRAAQDGLKVLVAAGDTFRAAAQTQLKTWTDRANVEIFSPEGVKDPAAVAFDATQMAKAKGFDLVIIDTAGRLHTQKNLMEELKKVKRVIEKVIPEAPHQVLIVLDGNSGQNAMVQAREFNQSLTLTGAVVTKLDGTAKGGVILSLACELELPTRMIGIGEGIEDLKHFSASDYIDALI